MVDRQPGWLHHVDMDSRVKPHGSMDFSALDEISSVVRERRRARGMTQTELAELADVSRSFVYDLESGSSSLQMAPVLRVLAVFGRTLIVGGASAVPGRHPVTSERPVDKPRS